MSKQTTKAEKPIDPKTKGFRAWINEASPLEIFALSIAALGTLVFFCYLIALWQGQHLVMAKPLNIEKSALIGDFLGGVVGAIWALAGVLFFYSALTLQRKEFKLQRLELESNRIELRAERITNTIYKQLEVINQEAMVWGANKGATPSPIRVRIVNTTKNLLFYIKKHEAGSRNDGHLVTLEKALEDDVNGHQYLKSIYQAIILVQALTDSLEADHSEKEEKTEIRKTIQTLKADLFNTLLINLPIEHLYALTEAIDIVGNLLGQPDKDNEKPVMVIIETARLLGVFLNLMKTNEGFVLGISSSKGHEDSPVNDSEPTQITNLEP